MERADSNLGKKLTSLGLSSAIIIAALAIGEIACRTFTKINLEGNSRGMFSARRFRDSYGNTPGFQGVSYGEPFTIDKNGFRVGSGHNRQSKAANSLLVLGDSVGFGIGVPEEKSIAGILRSKMNSDVYNASAIGYWTFDYRNAGMEIIAERHEIDRIIVLFCLNDVSGVTSESIQRQIAAATDPSVSDDLGIFSATADFLNSHSKLFVFLKNLARDQQSTHFLGIQMLYRSDPVGIDRAIAPLAELDERLRSRNIPMTIFILPNEAQLRTGTQADFLVPQERLAVSFRTRGLQFVDLFPAFREAGIESRELFLHADPMHLSEKGSAVAAETICAFVQGCDQI